MNPKTLPQRTISQEQDRYWQSSPEDLARKLDSPASGLTSEEAGRLLKRYGPNSIRSTSQAPPWKILLGQFKSPIILILIAAALVSLYFQSYTDTIIILAIVLASGLLGFVQEFSASSALGKLLSVVKVTSNVLRDGKPQEIPSDAIVPGDRLILAAGDLVPADCLLLEANDLYLDEALLTGETMPVRKTPGILQADQPTLSQMTNTLFMGTHVQSGSSQALVIHTGQDTQFGQIANRLRLTKPATDFEHGVAHFGTLLLEVTLTLVILIFAANVIFQRPVLESLLFSLALAVGLVPQLLPAIITINLSKGAQAMARKKVIVKRLAAIENFGSMQVLCTDKTGTLTEGTIRLHAALDPLGQPNEQVRLLGTLNASFQTGIRNPIDQAILAANNIDLAPYQKLDEIPYDFVRKRLSVAVRMPDGSQLLISKGALDNILAVCSQVQLEDQVISLDKQRAAIDALYQEWSGQGLRILGLATRVFQDQRKLEPEDEQGMTFLGFLLFLDPPKADAHATLDRLASLGVKVKVITGDNRLVTAYLAGQVGLKAEHLLTGSDLKAMSEEALVAVCTTVDCFAEIEPNQKERIIRALQKAGAVTGYMGDGINDAPALHVADVGISVNSAVDVAKDAAEIVMLDSSLDTLAGGVLEGRRTFANTLKYVFMATSANFGNMFSMAGVSLLLSFLPLLPTQILLTNFLTDFPELTIATDNVDPELLKVPRRWDMRFIRRFMVTFGLLSSIFDYATFGILLLIFGANPELFRTGWFVESVLSASLVVLVIRTRRPFYRSRPSPYLAGTTALIALVVISLPYLGPIANLFGFVPLPALYWLFMLALLVSYALLAEVAKRFFYRHN